MLQSSVHSVLFHESSSCCFPSVHTPAFHVNNELNLVRHERKQKH